MGVFQNNLMGAAAAASAGGADFYDYQIDKSLRLPLRTSGFSKTYSGSDGDDEHFTLSWWQKGRPPGHNQPMDVIDARDGTDNSSLNELYFADSTASAGTGGDSLCLVHSSSGNKILCSTNLFRDPSAWYHFVVRADMDNATASERLKFYVNGTEMSYATDNRSSYSSAAGFGNAGSWYLFRYHNGSYGLYSNVAEMHYIDGTSLTPSSFGETKNGVWIPKEYDTSDGAYGTLGFYLKFESSSDLGNDSSGNNNDWTTVDLSAHDQMSDSPTFDSSSNGGSFATLNPLASLAGITFSEGNLKEVDDNSGWQTAWSTMAAKSGKFYFEAEYTTDSRDRGYIGVAQTKDLATYQDSYYAGQTNNSAGWYSANGSVYINASTTGTTLNTYTTNDIVGCAIDIDNGYVYFSKNGTWENSGDPASGSSGTGGFSLSNSTTGDPWHLIVSNWGAQFIVNYGQEGTFAGETTAGGNSDTNGFIISSY